MTRKLYNLKSPYAFPRYSEKNDKRIKLSTKDVIKIKQLHTDKILTIAETASLYNVTPSSIRYRLLTKKGKELKRKRERLRARKEKNKRKVAKASSKYMKRKICIQREEIGKYRSSTRKNKLNQWEKTS